MCSWQSAIGHIIFSFAAISCVSCNALAVEDGVVFGSVELSSGDRPDENVLVEFIVLRTSQVLLFGNQSPKPPLGNVAFFLFFDTRNPFGVSVETDRRIRMPFNGKFGVEESVNFAQEYPGLAGGHANFFGNITLGVFGQQFFLGIDDIGAHLIPDTPQNPFVSEFEIEGSESNCEGFRITQREECILTKAAPSLKLRDYKVGKGRTETISSIVTSVRYSKPVDLRVPITIPFSVEVKTTYSDGKETLTSALVRDLNWQSKAAAEAIIEDFYRFLGTGLECMTKSNIQLAIDKGVIMVATEAGMQDRITALSYFEKNKAEFPAVRLMIICFVLLLAVVILVFKQKRKSNV